MFSFIGWFYLIGRSKGRFIPQVPDDEPEQAPAGASDTSAERSTNDG